MSDIAIEEHEVEQEVDFAHYVTATKEIVEEFRDVLAQHTAKLDQEAINLGGQTSPEHIAEKAEMHRLRIGCDNFLNVLLGNF